MIYVNPIPKYKQLLHHYTKQVIEITHAYTCAHTCAHIHMHRPRGYPMHLVHAHTHKITRAHTRVYTYMQSSPSYLTCLMHATKQTYRITQYQS